MAPADWSERTAFSWDWQLFAAVELRHQQLKLKTNEFSQGPWAGMSPAKLQGNLGRILLHPGLYRFVVDTPEQRISYVGEGRHLGSRLEAYFAARPRGTAARVVDAMRKVMTRANYDEAMLYVLEGAQMEFSIQSAPYFDATRDDVTAQRVDSREQFVDVNLESQFTRRAIENVTIMACLTAGEAVVNIDGRKSLLGKPKALRPWRGRFVPAKQRIV